MVRKMLLRYSKEYSMENTMAPYLFNLVLDYVMRVAIGNDEDMLLGFTERAGAPSKINNRPGLCI